jgi:subtilisin family serine protease
MYRKAGPGLLNRLTTGQSYDTFEINIFLTGEPAREYLSEMETAPSDQPRSALEEIKKRHVAYSRDLEDFLKTQATTLETIDAEVSVPGVVSYEPLWINNSVNAEVSLKVLGQILQRSDVQYVEMVRRVDWKELLDGSLRERGRRRGATATDDSVSAPTWSVKRVNAPLLWQKDLRGKGVLVAVVDTGVNYKHPDLKAKMWDGGTDYPNHGYDFVNNDDDPIDDDGHGTSCAGLVAGDGTSGKNTGIAPDATIMAVRAGSTEAVIWKGLQFALSHKAHVISMSLSWKFPSHPDYPGWRRVCETILAAGVLHANSIGNQGDRLTTYPIPYNIATPGNCPPPRLHPNQTIVGDISSPISCGATDDSDSLASYSGRGPAAWESAPYTDYPYANGTKLGLIKPDVCAPGPGTESCNWLYPQQSRKPYSEFGGTSSATPHVAGCLALLTHACLRSRNPIVPARIQEALENTAVRVVGQSRDKENHYGAGRVDVFAAFKYGEAKGWWA